MSPHRQVTVAELMTPSPATIRERAALAKAAAEMEERDIRHVPVVDAAGAVVGMLSDRDVRRWVGGGMRGVHVADAMARDVLTVRPQTVAHEAAALMLDHKIGGLPVVDDDGKLVGILTDTDLLRVAYQVLGGT